MPTISRIRLTNVIYENNAKRYNDQIFRFDGENGIFLLENGGGKTVFLQTVLQAIIPHATMAERKIKDTLVLDNSPAHIAIEWITQDKPRRYALTAVSLYTENNTLMSYKYVYSYGPEDKYNIETLPFVVHNSQSKARPASKGEISEYYSRMKQQFINADTFTTMKDYHHYIEENFKIVPGEWYKIAMINGSEGGIEEFFKHCRTTQQLINNLLIPTVEEALSGNEKIDFVQTFEKQREHFKQNKRLSEDIEQFKQIKERVDDYIHEYKRLHDSEEVYNEKKREAKALTKFILEEIDANSKEALSLKQEREDLDASKSTYEHQKQSLDIANLDQKIEQQESKRQEYIRIEFEMRQQLDDVKRRIQNIQITDLENQETLKRQMIVSLNEQLEMSQKTEEESDLREQIEKTMAYIHGYYVNQKETLEKEQQVLEGQLLREQDTLSDMKEGMNKKYGERSDAKGQISSLRTSIKNMDERMGRIKSQLFDPLTDENAEALLKRYKDRITDIEEQLRDLQKRKRDNEEVRCQLAKQKDDCLLKRQDAKSALEGNEAKKREIDKHQGELIHVLEGYFAHLGIYNTVYSKEDTIVQSVNDRLSKLALEFEELLIRERVNGRYADLYGDMPFFSADTVMAKKLFTIMNQVSYAEHGTLYLQNNRTILGKSMEELYHVFPFWANTIVTTESDKPKIMEYIRGIKHNLTNPVFILTTGEVQQILHEGAEVVKSDATVFPEVWLENLEQENFEGWKNEVIQKAKNTTVEREEIGRKLAEIQRLQEKVETYFRSYPYDLYMELNESIEDMKELMKSAEMELNQINESVQAADQDRQTIDHAIEALNQEKPTVSRWIELIDEYIKSLYRKRRFESEEQEAIKHERQLEQEQHRLQDALVRQEALLDELKKDVSRLRYTQQSIETEELYIKVKETAPEYGNEVYQVLKERLMALELKFKKVTGLSQEYVIKIESAKESLIDIQQRLKRIKDNAKYPIAKAADYEQGEWDRLEERARNLESQWEEWLPKVEAAKLELGNTRSRRDTKAEPIIERYGAVIIFKEPLNYVKDRLAEEKKALEGQEKTLKKAMASNEEKRIVLETTKHELDILSVEHGFSKVALTYYDRNTFINFYYEQGKVLGHIQEGLVLEAKRFEQMRLHMDKKKSDYLTFCRTMITEPKLKDTAIKGIDKKQNYAELLDYGTMMEEILQKNIKIAEDDRRESDAELQTFLAHLMTYTKNVIREIDAIQYKTKIKVEDQQKQIFMFHIPHWDELAAKEELRRYINQLVEDYDLEYDKALEDRESAREYIESKLSVSNLMLRILGDKTIKIKCRKVTNDLKVRHAPMTWESSNKWSGGEKWSKNMTLFLSILNYMAEKKKYMGTSEKRHRTVILDNPFGKASSKHVLDPVFFVAENLGFQMITVTAHAEGQFVTDYFPVVYSGKLRASNDPDKQIMEVNKSLNTAYFKAESPDTLLRFEEHEQLSFLVD